MSYPEIRYKGDLGEISSRFRSAENPYDVNLGTVSSLSYIASGTSTEGRFGLYRMDMHTNTPGANAHFHRTMSESFFIISGIIQLYNGEGWIDGKAGDFLYVPEGGIHGFRNQSGKPASVLILFSPGAPREKYFEALAEIAAGRQVSQEEFVDICIRHDNIYIDEPFQSLYKKMIGKYK